jgi:hypothetical protein
MTRSINVWFEIRNADGTFDEVERSYDSHMDLLTALECAVASAGCADKRGQITSLDAIGPWPGGALGQEDDVVHENVYDFADFELGPPLGSAKADIQKAVCKLLHLCFASFIEEFEWNIDIEGVVDLTRGVEGATELWQGDPPIIVTLTPVKFSKAVDGYIEDHTAFDGSGIDPSAKIEMIDALEQWKDAVNSAILKLSTLKEPP